MTIHQHHLINSQIFNIHFSDQEQADDEQNNGLTEFIKTRLLQIIDTVFTDCCPDQAMITLDTLVLDLGTIPSQGYRDEMAYRLQRDLAKLLKDKIPQLPDTPHERERKLTPGQGDLETLRYFLETGQLPWTVASEADPLTSRLRRLLDKDTDALLSLLANLRQPDAALQRLKQQFPSDLVKRVREGAAAGKNEQQRKLTQLFAKVGVSSTDTEKQNQRVLYLIKQALFEHRLAPLRNNWTELLQKYPQLLHEAIFKYGQQSEVRQTIARTFSDPMFRDLLQLLEPSEHVFMEEIVFRPSLPSSKANKAASNETGEKKRLREFTLTYLLTERGSRFNKKSYLASVLRRMAAHDNVAASAVLASIRISLLAVPAQTRIQQEIIQLLTEVQEDNELVTVSVDSEKQDQKGTTQPKGDEQQFIQLLEQAFYEQLPASLKRQWQRLLKLHPNLLHQELHRHGQSALVRRQIAVEFSDLMFVDILELLEPQKSSFLEQVVFHSSLTSEQENKRPGHNKRVREFTLAYLLTERGSFFNKKAYLGSLLTRIAAHDNMAFSNLVQSLHTAFSPWQHSGTQIQKEVFFFFYGPTYYPRIFS